MDYPRPKNLKKSRKKSISREILISGCWKVYNIDIYTILVPSKHSKYRLKFAQKKLTQMGPLKEVSCFTLYFKTGNNIKSVNKKT